MTPDRLDALIRNTFPASAIPPEQVRRVVDGVFARLGRPAPPTRWQRAQALLAELTPSLPALVRQAALPVGMALALGLYVGQFLPPAPRPPLLASLTTPSSLLMAGD